MLKTKSECNVSSAVSIALIWDDKSTGW